MGWQTVKSGGKIFVDAGMRDGKGVRITNDFLQKFLQHFIRASRKFYEFAGEMPFEYREKQLNSTVFTAFSNAADIVLLEHPVTRKCEMNGGKNGWLDYWVLCRNIVFLVELKHHFNALSTSAIRVDGVEKWQTAVSQIQSVTNLEDLCGKVNGVVKLALMVVVNYESSKERNKLEIKKDEELLDAPLNQYKSFVKQLSPPPNWSATWHLHPSLREPREIQSGSWQVFPTVDFFVRAEVVPRLAR